MTELHVLFDELLVAMYHAARSEAATAWGNRVGLIMSLLRERMGETYLSDPAAWTAALRAKLDLGEPFTWLALPPLRVGHGDPLRFSQAKAEGLVPISGTSQGMVLDAPEHAVGDSNDDFF